MTPNSCNCRMWLKKSMRSGFGVPTTKLEMPVTGMTCANCAANIERALNKKVAGVVNGSGKFCHGAGRRWNISRRLPMSTI